MSKDRGHDWGFFVWVTPGFLVVFGCVTTFSIGLPFLALGLGLLLAAIAVITENYSPMPWGPHRTRSCHRELQCFLVAALPSRGARAALGASRSECVQPATWPWARRLEIDPAAPLADS